MKDKLAQGWAESMISPMEGAGHDPLERFIFAWRGLRARKKELQSEAVAKLSTLETMRVELETVTVEETPGNQERVLFLSKQIVKLQVWRTDGDCGVESAIFMLVICLLHTFWKDID
ncbi:hypothetical protein R1flu_026415 [Riccia fluitans]|uniref:Uncharacterized protein n=1 Tax=Riccia fluitans TaxID=41844 RepID=A0ABD1XFW4_9MARC